MPAISAPNVSAFGISGQSETVVSPVQSYRKAGTVQEAELILFIPMFFIDIAVVLQEYAPASHRLGWPPVRQACIPEPTTNWNLPEKEHACQPTGVHD